MYTLLFVIVVFWIFRIIHNVVYYAHLWWVKEYRFDRMMIHLRTPQAKAIVIPPWKHPPISPKSIALVTLSLLFLFLLYRSLSFTIWIKLLIVDAASFVITFPLVWMLWIPTKIYHAMKIFKASKRLKQNPSMVVIGITGSYGKTSVKEFLFDILRTKYKTLKTEASKNSPIGIAEVVLEKLERDHEIFIVEMGAYKKGEIANMAKMVQPQIGIITAINAQHQDLFGSIENTMHAKFELIDHLVGKQIAVLNADNARVRTMGQWAEKKHISITWYEASNAKNLISNLDGLVFELDGISITIPILGKHQVSNIMAAITVAKILGMSTEEIARGVKQISNRAHTLEKKNGPSGSIFIDDTFNNNPDAAMAALDVLQYGRGKKILVFQPMIELGSFAHDSHVQVGAYAAGICDEIILTNVNWYNDIVRGVRSISQKTPVVVWNPTRTKNELRYRLKKDDMVLFKGKEAQKYLHELQ